MTTARIIALGCVLFLIAGGLAFFFWQKEHSAQTFFSNALSSAGVTIPANSSLSSLELLYGQAMAERSPLFGIAGTDPSTLAGAVSALATSTAIIAAAQTDTKNAQLAQELYPIDFLDSLAKTEAARQAFIADASPENEQAYDNALHATAAAGEQDAQAFESALQTIVGTSTVTMTSSGYPITGTLMLQSASSSVARMKALNAELAQRDSCLAGNIGSCDAGDIALPHIAPAALPPSSAPLPSINSEFLSTLSAALPAGYFSDATVVRLDSSACLGAFPAPYYAIIDTDDVSSGQLQYLYSIGNGLFTPMQRPGSGPPPAFAQAYGIAYLYEDSFMFYECPEAAADLSEMFVIADTAQFAQEHPDLAPNDAAALEGSVADEGYARDYVSTALDHASDPAEQSALITLALEFNEEDADLSTFVGEIASIDQFNIKAQQEGLLSNWSDVSSLFLTSSAFPSLFLESDASSSPPVASIRDEDPALLSADLLSFTETYAVLRAKISDSEISRNIEGLMAFENGAPR